MATSLAEPLADPLNLARQAGPQRTPPSLNPHTGRCHGLAGDLTQQTSGKLPASVRWVRGHSDGVEIEVDAAALTAALDATLATDAPPTPPLG